MKTNANDTRIFAAVALVVGGFAQIAFVNNLGLGLAGVGVGIILGIQAFFKRRSK